MSAVRPALLGAAAALALALSAGAVAGAQPAAADGSAHRLDPRLRASADARGADAWAGVRVTVTGQASRVPGAVRRAGGQLIAASALGAGQEQASVVVPAGRLGALAASTGVQAVRHPNNAVPIGFDRPAAVTTSGYPPGAFLTASNAAAWQSAQVTGTGVTIGIIDVGFAGLTTAMQTGGPLAGVTVNYSSSPTASPQTNFCGTAAGSDTTTDHGTEVAEVVHQAAPGATLNLYCIADDVGFANAAAQAETPPGNVQIMNTSLAFYGEGRGDGSGIPGSVDETVRSARQQGILWFSAAGNEAADHLSGTFTNSASAGQQVLATTTVNGVVTRQTSDAFYVTGPTTSSPAPAVQVALQWDDWGTAADPGSSAPVQLQVQRYNCGQGSAPPNPPPPGGCISPGNLLSTSTATQAAHSPPTLDMSCPDQACKPLQPTKPLEEWVVSINLGAHTPAVRYDLSYFNAGSASALSGVTAGNPYPVALAAAGSIAQPADSPYVVAVGATDLQAAPATGSGSTAQPVAGGCVATADATRCVPEPFSSQGRTIDGRVKPDLIGYDDLAVTSYGTGTSGTPVMFTGTSAAVATVAGEAALVMQAQGSSATVEQVVDYLQRQAGINPATSVLGYGVLTLGGPGSAAVPTGSGYTGLSTPARVFDTSRPTDNGGRPVGYQRSAVVTLTAAVPSDATAVAINLTGVVSSQGSYLSVYPGTAGTPFPGTSNLNLTAGTDGTAAVFAVVPVYHSSGGATSIVVYNGGSPTRVVIDLAGYFSPATGAAGLVTLSTPVRVYDSRVKTPTNGNAVGKLAPGSTRTITLPSSAVPADASAVMVNVTADGGTAGAVLTAAATCTGTTSTLNYTQGYTRANLAIVGLTGSTLCLVDRAYSGAIDVVLDVLGYFTTDATSQPVPALFTPLESPVRVLDTRTGNGYATYVSGSGGHSVAPQPLLNGVDNSIYPQLAGVGTVPTAATAVFGNVTAVAPTSGGWLRVTPGVGARTISTLNFSTGRIVPNAFVSGLGRAPTGNPPDPSVAIDAQVTSTNVVLDVFGYFLPMTQASS